jgi:hypothetical protein
MLAKITGDLSRGCVTDECWLIIADSEIIRDLIHCLSQDVDFDFAQHVTFCLRQLLDQSSGAVEAFIENGGIPPLCKRIVFTESVTTLRYVLGVLRIIERNGFGSALAERQEWLEQFLQIPRNVTETPSLCEFANFLPVVVRIFPAVFPLICQITTALLETSVKR